MNYLITKTQAMTTLAAPQNKGKLVGTQHVDTLIRHYKKERWIQNSERLGKPDSLSVWYGLEELSCFLELARENHADGIKMYFGTYPPDYAEVPEFQGRQTVVFVATKETKTNNGLSNKDIYLNRGGKMEILAFNFGCICPPFCKSKIHSSANGEFGIELEKIGISIIEEGERLIIA